VAPCRSPSNCRLDPVTSVTRRGRIAGHKHPDPAPPQGGDFISVEELRALLAEGEPVTVLDIRTDRERSEWWIPGSIHVDAYAALNNGELGPLSSIDLPGTTPVVTICGVGGTAALAAKHLRERGINALTLAGGMKAWSLAWNTAEVANA
jgi:rhodanese-related sulfurtransferase